jgi:hypothetical protein
MEKDYISTLLRSNDTVFTFKELSLIWNETDVKLTKKRVYRYIKMGKLYPIRKGIYAKDKNYHFDNLSSINWDICFEMLPIYNNKAMAMRLNSYHKLA